MKEARCSAVILGNDAPDRLVPNVIVMDVRMPVMDGIEATRQITRDRSGSRVLILTTFDLDEYVLAYESGIVPR
jgi:DNA-binding NarL/FixJ family response regulator